MSRLILRFSSWFLGSYTWPPKKLQSCSAAQLVCQDRLRAVFCSICSWFTYHWDKPLTMLRIITSEMFYHLCLTDDNGWMKYRATYIVAVPIMRWWPAPWLPILQIPSWILKYIRSSILHDLTKLRWGQWTIRKTHTKALHSLPVTLSAPVHLIEHCTSSEMEGNRPLSLNPLS